MIFYEASRIGETRLKTLIIPGIPTVRFWTIIDSHKEIKTWVRNIERQPSSFWLPTHDDRFYPDFVAELVDGRILVVEYKGEHLATNEDTQEKDLIGRLWADRSNGKCLFLMATKFDEQGRDIHGQISNILC